VDVAQARHSSAVGKTRQQDMLRAQLELTRLEERLNMLFQQYDTAVQSLHEWLESTSNGGYQAYGLNSKHIILQMMRMERGEAWIKALRRRK